MRNEWAIGIGRGCCVATLAILFCQCFIVDSGHAEDAGSKPAWMNYCRDEAAKYIIEPVELESGETWKRIEEPLFTMI